MAFKPGDVVTLRSGGPAMTVVSVAETEAKCVWIGEEGDFFQESIPTVALDLIETDDDLDELDEDDEDDDDDELDEDDEDDDEEDEDEDVTKTLLDEDIEDVPPRARRN